MALAYFSIAFVAYLTTASAYNFNYFPNFYGQETRMADSYQGRSNDRVANERSTPYGSEVQRVQQRKRVRHDEMQLQNWNNPQKLGNSYIKNPSLTNWRGAHSAAHSAYVFPGPTSRSSMFVPEVPKECEEMGICEDIPNYPHEYVDYLIAQAGITKYRFNLDVMTSEIAQRRGAENEELCRSEEKIIYPSAAKNNLGKWVLIVNKKYDKVQGFKGEVCEKVEQPCNHIIYPAEGHMCLQKMTQRAMWSVNETGYMVLDTIPIPSCCSCFMNKTMSLGKS